MAPVMTIEQFCNAHQISRAFFNLLRHRGEAPTFMQVGRRILITTEGAAEWRKRHTVMASAVESGPKGVGRP
ncbi:MAG: hypothetical protein IPM03_17070 [Sulfuritalea sp.]|nr:hypothetical protein [Sulfuritalea sp.]